MHTSSALLNASDCDEQPENALGYKEQHNHEKRRLIMATLICLLFMIAEVIGGLLAHSLAILSDAAHLLSDIAGFAISIFALHMATWPASKSHTFGYHRAEILGAIVSVSVIWVLTVFLLVEAVDRIKNPQVIDGKVMFITACLGLIVNILMAFTLHKPHDHGHHHGHHDHSLNLKSAMIHVIGDLIQSIGVLIASIVIWVKPGWTLADPLCTFLFSIIVFGSTFRIVREATHILMEGSPSDVDLVSLVQDLLRIQGVKKVADLHVWSLSSGKSALSAKIIIDGDRHPCVAHQTAAPNAISSCTCHLSAQKHLIPSEYSWIISQSESLLCEKYNIHHSTLQIGFIQEENEPCHKPIVCFEM